MNERVFSETEGSPRLPSASFARVDQESDQGQDLPPVSDRCFRGYVCETGTECRRAFQCLGHLRSYLSAKDQAAAVEALL